MYSYVNRMLCYRLFMNVTLGARFFDISVQTENITAHKTPGIELQCISRLALSYKYELIRLRRSLLKEKSSMI